MQLGVDVLVACLIVGDEVCSSNRIYCFDKFYQCFWIRVCNGAQYWKSLKIPESKTPNLLGIIIFSRSKLYAGYSI